MCHASHAPLWHRMLVGIFTAVGFSSQPQDPRKETAMNTCWKPLLVYERRSPPLILYSPTHVYPLLRALTVSLYNPNPYTQPTSEL